MADTRCMDAQMSTNPAALQCPPAAPGRCRGELKRDAALQVIADFKAAVSTAFCKRRLSGATRLAVRRLHELQGIYDERRYLSRSLCQIGTVLRRAGHVDLCIDVLKDAIGFDAVDAYVLSELVQCHVAQADLDAAVDVLHLARHMRLLAESMFPPLVAAAGRSGNVALAEQIFREAAHAGMDTSFTCTSMIDAYGRAGMVSSARTLLNETKLRGHVCPASYTALITAYARNGDVEGAEAVLSEAEAAGHCDRRTYHAFISADLATGRCDRARIIFDRARADGLVDARTYGALIGAYAHRNQFGQAILLAQAEQADMATAATYQVLIAAFARTNQWRRARKLHVRACRRPQSASTTASQPGLRGI